MSEATDPFTMATRMCDDDGIVSETVADDVQGLTHPELHRLTYLDKVNNMRRHTGLRPVEPFACTGSAHLAGEHIRCTSPAHQQPSRLHVAVDVIESIESDAYRGSRLCPYLYAKDARR